MGRPTESRLIALGGGSQILTYLEIGPLKETEYTGIAHVTSALAAEMLEHDPSSQFFFGRTLVDREVVADLLASRNGDLLEWHVAKRVGRPAPISAPGIQVGIYPNRKTSRRAFDFEVQIIHDLSTLLTPQYHHQDTIDYHALSMDTDIATNDLTVCVSEATRTDVLTYLPPADPASVVTIYNAASAVRVVEPEADHPLSGRPSIVILGTVEPRKNIDQVLAFLRDSPSFTDSFRFIFLGRYGWGTKVEDLVAAYGLQDELERGTIAFPGFVSDARKNALVRGAHLLIYPSLFEGYGLPIVEAMQEAVPCLTTASSSLPEVGGATCFYFDPFHPEGFRQAFVDALVAIAADGPALRERCRRQAEAFSWHASYRQLMAEISSRAGGGRVGVGSGRTGRGR